MSETLFPTIGPAECRQYIATARLSPNAVALRINQMLAKPVMHRVCMHCACNLGDVPCIPEMAGKTSHGICPACVKIHWPDFSLQRDAQTSEPLGVAALDGTTRHAASITAAGGANVGSHGSSVCGAGGGLSSRHGTGRACVPLELVRTIEPSAVAQACSEPVSMSPDGIPPSEGAETGRKTARTESEPHAENNLEGDATTVRKANERTGACENSGYLPAPR